MQVNRKIGNTYMNLDGRAPKTGFLLMFYIVYTSPTGFWVLLGLYIKISVIHNTVYSFQVELIITLPEQ